MVISSQWSLVPGNDPGLLVPGPLWFAIGYLVLVLSGLVGYGLINDWFHFSFLCFLCDLLFVSYS